VRLHGTFPLEGLVMHTRCLLIAAATLAVAGNAAAEPAKPAPKPAAQPAERPVEIVMASAEQVRTPAPLATQPVTQEVAPVKRPRAARVTSCRCAGQNQP
jgi:hypothetical protein